MKDESEIMDGGCEAEAEWCTLGVGEGLAGGSVRETPGLGLISFSISGPHSARWVEMDHWP